MRALIRLPVYGSVWYLTLSHGARAHHRHYDLSHSRAGRLWWCVCNPKRVKDGCSVDRHKHAYTLTHTHSLSQCSSIGRRSERHLKCALHTLTARDSHIRFWRHYTPPRHRAPPACCVYGSPICFLSVLVSHSPCLSCCWSALVHSSSGHLVAVGRARLLPHCHTRTLDSRAVVKCVSVPTEAHDPSYFASSSCTSSAT